MIAPIRFPQPPTVKQLLAIYAAFGVIFAVGAALFLAIVWLLIQFQ